MPRRHVSISRFIWHNHLNTPIIADRYASSPIPQLESEIAHGPNIAHENVPLDEARKMSRRPRMDLELYHALRGKIQSPDNTATRITIPEGTGPTTLKNRIPRVAAELGMPVTIRRVAGSLLFWRSIDENLQQAREIPQRLQTALSKGRSPPSRRRRA
jgi:D-alanine-D-alanine ligase-like ATP-grasp enzyme